MNSTATPIEQQLDAYVAGSLCGDEATSLERQITSDPAVARAYADACLRADQTTGTCSAGKPRHDPQHDEPCETHSLGLIGRLCRFFGGPKD